MPTVKSLETQELLSVQSFPRHALVSPVLGHGRWYLARIHIQLQPSLASLHLTAPHCASLHLTAVLGHCLLELPGSYSSLLTQSRPLQASTDTLN